MTNWGDSKFGLYFSNDFKIYYKDKIILESERLKPDIFGMMLSQSPSKRYIGVVFHGNDGFYHELLFDSKTHKSEFRTGTAAYRHFWDPKERYVITHIQYEGDGLQLSSLTDLKKKHYFQMSTDSLYFQPNAPHAWLKKEIVFDAVTILNPYLEPNDDQGYEKRWPQMKAWLFRFWIKLEEMTISKRLIKEIRL
jgi:hypothetical protein